jgi:hypothetical protein
MSAGVLLEGEYMLLVKTTIAPSPIHGIGLFADQFIPQGTRIWEFTTLLVKSP